MFQNKTLKKYMKISIYIFMTAYVFSCSPKASGVRAQVKTGSTNLNPAVSTQAEQQAAAQNLIYRISSVSTPNQTDLGYTVENVLLDPSNQTLPFTTQHENGLLDSQGIYNDTSRGVQVYVQARCSSDECFKYILLVTVVRNNQSLFQTAAISFKNDCKYNSISVGSNSGQMFQSLDDVESRYSNLSPKNDIDLCSQ